MNENIDSPQERPLNTGNNADDDPQVIDSFFTETQEPPDKAASIVDPDGPLPVPIRRPTRLLTGNVLLDPNWSKPTLLLPEDLNRERLALSVIPTKRNYEENIPQVDATTNPLITLTAPYMIGMIITQDLGAARLIGYIDVTYGNNETFGFDMAEGSGGGPLAPYSWWAGPSNGFPAQADGTIDVQYTNIAGTGDLSITVIGYAGDADFINLADDPAKLEQDPSAGRIDIGHINDVLPGHTGAVWATARNSFGPIRVSWWGVTK